MLVIASPHDRKNRKYNDCRQRVEAHKSWQLMGVLVHHHPIRTVKFFSSSFDFPYMPGGCPRHTNPRILGKSPGYLGKAFPP